MNLSQALEKKTYKIVKIKDREEVKGKLSSMGLSTGTIVVIVKNDFSGPVILGIDSSRISLGRSIADKIEVSL